MVSIYNYIIKQPSLPSVSEKLVMYFSPFPLTWKSCLHGSAVKEEMMKWCCFFFLFQFEALKQYIEKGGSLLILLGEGGESRFDTNINFLIEDYGIMVNNGQYVTAVHHFKHFLQMFFKILPSPSYVTFCQFVRCP